MVRRAPGPDRFEKGVRFVAGALIGAFVGMLLALRLASSPALVPWLVGIAGFAVLVGALAVRYGDGFWRVVCDSLWWIPWW